MKLVEVVKFGVVRELSQRNFFSLKSSEWFETELNWKHLQSWKVEIGISRLRQAFIFLSARVQHIPFHLLQPSMFTSRASPCLAFDDSYYLESIFTPDRYSAIVSSSLTKNRLHARPSRNHKNNVCLAEFDISTHNYSALKDSWSGFGRF